MGKLSVILIVWLALIVLTTFYCYFCEQRLFPRQRLLDWGAQISNRCRSVAGGKKGRSDSIVTTSTTSGGGSAGSKGNGFSRSASLFSSMASLSSAARRETVNAARRAREEREQSHFGYERVS